MEPADGESCNIPSMRKPLGNDCERWRVPGSVWARAFVSTLGALVWVAFCLHIRADEFEFFEKKIRPVLAERCYKCHSREAEKLKSELFLDSKEGMLKGGESGKPAIVPGNAEASRLVEAVRYTNEELQMPPPKIGRLTAQQVADFVAWVNLGAPDPRAKAATNAAPLADKYKAARSH